MDVTLTGLDGSQHAGDPTAVRALLAAGTPFWLDLGIDDPSQLALLKEEFGFHPLAIEDAEHFGQRPKLDTYEDFAFLVVFGATEDGRLVEVHCFFTEHYLVTVHHEPCPPIHEACERLRRGGARAHSTLMVLYRVVDALVDGFFPSLASFDDRIDDLEDEILQRPTEDQMGQLFDMKRSLIALRKVVTPQRDLFATFLSGREELVPGMTPDAERYFRDLYDHLIRVSDMVDSYRDLLSGVLDTHLSTVSNRLNVVMKQLTIIATIFLPLSFLTGFFGQNFGWMVNRITSLPVFVVVGIGLQVATVVGLLLLFRFRGWLGAETAPAPTTRRRTRPARELRWRSLHPYRSGS